MMNCCSAQRNPGLSLTQLALNLREAHVTQVRGTEAAARVADVLMVFTDGPKTLGVTTIARELKLSKAVVHRILNSLVDRKLLSSDPRTREYHLGAAAAALGARALRGSKLRSVALPVLRSLRKATNETVTVSALVPGGRVYLAKDGRMHARHLAAMYPRLDEWREVQATVDPKGLLRSDLARRLRLLAP